MFAPAVAQVPKQQIAPAQAAQFEAVLRSDPNNLEARRALLQYYYLGRLDPAIAIPARRTHILWFIEHAPDDQGAGGPAATIDAAGHLLADPVGFKQASDAWRVQVQRTDAKAAALVNAAYFFKLSDKEFTVRLLERALALDPGNIETAARLGDEYALAILGVTMVNKNGYPLRVDPSLTGSGFAMQARAVLKTSQNPYLLAKAGYQLAWQGGVLFGTGQLSFDPNPVAEEALTRAARIAPNDEGVKFYMQQYREMRQQQAAPQGRPAAR
jgi:hypothetical protein